MLLDKSWYKIRNDHNLDNETVYYPDISDQTETFIFKLSVQKFFRFWH